MSIVKRTTVALTVGLLVFGISCDVAYYQFRGSAIRAGQEATFRDIGILRQAVEAYQQENHALPGSLRDVLPIPEAYVHLDRNGAPADSWYWPLHYSKDGGRYRIVSYGRDGEPGGAGLDFDLSSDDLGAGWAWEPGTPPPPLPAQSAPTVGQFMADQGGTREGGGTGRRMIFTCILTGLVASLLAFVAAGGDQPGRQGVRARITRLLLIAFGTLLVAIMYVIPLHAPSIGH